MDLTQRRGRGYKYLSQLQRAINCKRSKVRYRGLAKNGNRLCVAAALANLYIVRGPLLDARKV